MLKTIMSTEHEATDAPIELQVDEKGRLYVNGERVATQLDLTRNTLIPLWLAGAGAAVQGLMYVIAYCFPPH